MGEASAQSSDSSSVKMDYVQPFSGGHAFRTWSIGFNAGVMSTYSVLTSNNKLDFTLPNVQYGYGGYIKKQILPALGIRADVFFGKLNGDNAQLNDKGVSPFKSFTTKINYASSLSTDITLANINWHDVKGSIRPYFFSGVGIMNYKPEITTAGGTTRNFAGGNGAINEIFAPVGVGLRFSVSRGVNLELAYQVNFVYSDNLDGYKYGATNDRFSYAHIGLEFAIGKRSKPQLAAHNPVSSMRQEYLWQIKNARDAFKALGDSDKAQNDSLKKQVSALRVKVDKLTTDSDGDGVPDFYDKCPGTAAGSKVDGSGCPLPIAKAAEKVYVTEEEKSVVKEAVKNLEFASGQAVIADQSYASLEQLAKLLVDKNLHLKLAGYTDNTGSATANARLSKQRAEAVKMFLVSRGANPAMIDTEGYGQTNPIASNKTAAGRRLNRRVEFTLY